ncbi:MAG: sigma-54-dependent Fis family transcriptional regulator [Deltaproteobacteria bacterium]|nr:sigma-54-dependent Fis family transcriptional regulator [Deltaproteobacteria bacterium]
MAARILVVDDDESMCQMLEAGLSRRGFQVDWRTSGEAALQQALADDYDAVVTDLNMKGVNGLQLCERIVQNRPDTPVVVITAFGSLETAVGAIRVGAYDFITKPLEVAQLALTLDRAVKHRALSQEVKRLRAAVSEGRQFGELLGASPAMRTVYDLLDRIADSETTVLVTGESGTGKELVARALHARSRRKAGPFVAINCAAMPETLLESELFGHARGAFTDARTARAGLFLQAHQGTLFLDEIGEMPMGTQPKLLRVLQERVVRPVGADTEVAVDVRIIAATNRDLEGLLEEKRFREDLYYRLNVIKVELPPLRARGSDVLLLAQHFIDVFAGRASKNVVGILGPAAEKLLTYHWPGNVRELQNCMERAVALTRFDRITVDDLPEKIRDYRASHVLVAAQDPSELVPMEEVEKRYILRVLEAVGNNKTMASRVLGLDRKTLYRKLERWGMGTGDDA